MGPYAKKNPLKKQLHRKWEYEYTMDTIPLPLNIKKTLDGLTCH